VRTPVTDGSMTQFVYEFKRINNQPVPEAELDDARHAIVAGFALSLEKPAEMLGDWLSSEYYGFPADYWDNYPAQIAAVNAAAVQVVAKKYVDLDRMQWVAVGDRKQIEDVLKKYGSVTVVDAEGKPEN
jgi:zinc protease